MDGASVGPYSEAMTPDAARGAPGGAVPAFTLDLPAPGDADALAELHHRVWRHAYAGILPEHALGDTALASRRSTWHRMLAQWSHDQLSGRIRIGRAPDGAPAGFLTVGPSRDEGAPRPFELQALNVDPAFHGTGLAQALVRDLLQDRPAYLWVVEENPRARRFYEKVGFRADGGVKVDPDLGDLREIRMTR